MISYILIGTILKAEKIEIPIDYVEQSNYNKENVHIDSPKKSLIKTSSFLSDFQKSILQSLQIHNTLLFISNDNLNVES